MWLQLGFGLGLRVRLRLSLGLGLGLGLGIGLGLELGLGLGGRLDITVPGHEGFFHTIGLPFFRQHAVANLARRQHKRS